MTEHKMDTFSQFIVDILSKFPSDLGTVCEIHQTEDRRFVVLFEDTPWNWSARLAIAEALEFFTRMGIISLVGQDGSWSYIDTSSLGITPTISKNLKERVALMLLKDVRLSAGEYWRAMYTDTPNQSIWLYGVEDQRMYKRAEKLWKSQKMQKFFELEKDRAIAISDNLLMLMKEKQVQTAALTCCGNLPDLICQIWQMFPNISYARITPRSSALDVREVYDERMRGKRTVLEDIISKLPEQPGERMPLSADEWETQKLEEADRKRRMLNAGASIEEMVPTVKKIFTSPAFKKLSRSKKLEILSIFNYPFSVLKELIAPAELEEIFQADIHYLELEEYLSNPELEKLLPELESDIAKFVMSAPSSDIAKLLQSSKVTPNIKACIQRHVHEYEKLPEAERQKQTAKLLMEDIQKQIQEYGKLPEAERQRRRGEFGIAALIEELTRQKPDAES